MSFLVSLKPIRLLLAVCVSVWLAGGCLLGCGNAVTAAELDQSTESLIKGESCHTPRAHDCCAKPEPPKQNTFDPELSDSFLSLNSIPRGMMSDCPLAVSATAVAAKYNSHSPDATQATSPELPSLAGNGELPQKHVVAALVPNRGPTYLRCCVFRI